MSCRERVFQVMVGERIQSIRPFKFPFSCSLERSSMSSIVRLACVGAEVIPILLGKTQIGWEGSSSYGSKIQLPVDVMHMAIYYRRILVVLQGIVNSVDLRL